MLHRTHDSGCFAQQTDCIAVALQRRSWGAAARQGLKQGDVILQVGQETVNSPAEAIEQVKRYRSEDKSRPVVLLVERAGNQRFVAVKTG